MINRQEKVWRPFYEVPYFPSLLSANLLYLGKEIDELLSAGITTLHLDIMDNHYVPKFKHLPRPL